MPIHTTGRLLIVTLAVVAGILAADTFPLRSAVAPGLLYGGALLALLAAGAVATRRGGATGRSSLPALCGAALCFVFLGAARMTQVGSPGPADVSRLAGDAPVWIRTTVRSWADLDETGRQSFLADADGVIRGERTVAVNGQVRVSCPGTIAVSPGAVLWLQGRLTLPRGATNPGAFDYARFLERKGIFAVVSVRRAGEVRSGGTLGMTGAERAALWVRSGIHRAVGTYLSGEDAALMNGLLLSDRAFLPADFTDGLQRTGMVHILSVSGLHVAALAGAIALLLGALRVPRGLRAVLSLIALWVFVLASGYAPAALRSGIMASLFLLAPLVRRTPNAPHTLLVATLVLLLWEPGDVWDAGFQLSVATVGTLVLYAPLLTRLLVPPDSAQLAVLGRTARRARIAAEWVLVGILAGIVAEMGSAPLVAYHFNLFSPLSPLANLGVWVAELLTLAGLCLSGLSFVPPAILSLLWRLVAFCLHELQAWVGAWAALPFASFSVSSPPAAAVVLYYALLFAGTIILRRHVLKRTLFIPLPAAAPADTGGGLSAS